MLRKMKKLRKQSGQTALEYALVVAAISLVIMAAWNVVGNRVQEAIRGDMLERITNNLTKGNDAVRQ